MAEDGAVEVLEVEEPAAVLEVLLLLPQPANTTRATAVRTGTRRRRNMGDLLFRHVCLTTPQPCRWSQTASFRLHGADRARRRRCRHQGRGKSPRLQRLV